MRSAEIVEQFAGPVEGRGVPFGFTLPASRCRVFDQCVLQFDPGTKPGGVHALLPDGAFRREDRR